MDGLISCHVVDCSKLVTNRFSQTLSYYKITMPLPPIIIPFIKEKFMGISNKKKKNGYGMGEEYIYFFLFSLQIQNIKKNSADQDTTQPQQVVFMDLFKQIYIYNL